MIWKKKQPYPSQSREPVVAAVEPEVVEIAPPVVEPEPQPEPEEEAPLIAATAADAFSVPEADDLIFPEDAMFLRGVGAPTDVPEELDSSMDDWLADLMAEQGLDLEEETAEPEPEPATSFVELEAEPEPLVIVDEEPETAVAAPEPIEEMTEPTLELFAEVDGSLDWLDDLGEPVELDFEADVPDIETMTAPTTMADPFAAVADRLDAGIGHPVDSAFSSDDLEETLFADTEIDLDNELADSWPEWLSNDEDEQPGLGETGWLRTLAEPDVAGWLAAEEQGPEEKEFGDVYFGELESVTRAAFDVGPLPEPEPETVADLSDPRITVPILSVNPDDLESARKAMSAGKFGNAVQAYQTLVESGQGLSILIADLETAVHRHPGQPSVRRLLGDAYMRNGQLQKALDTYRHALDLM
ncbi:MAG: hypothetical protein R3E31_05965 [Chloroflexota bacterium]